MKILQLGNQAAVRYSTELYKNTVHNMYDLSVDFRMVKPLSVLGSAVGFMPETMLSDYSRYDLVHNVAGGAFLPLRGSDPIIVTSANEMQPVLFPELTPLLRNSLKDWLYYLLSTVPTFMTFKDTDYAIANSKLTAQGARFAGIPSDRIFLVHHGLDWRFRRPLHPRRKTRTFKCGTIGTLSPHKQTYFSIDAIKEIKDKDITLEIWGKSAGYSRSQVLRRISQNDRIGLMGYAPEGSLVDVYDSFDAFLFPSLFEGFGMPIIEAKARGVPVILWKHGHISPEIAKYCYLAKDPIDMAEIIQDIKENGYDPDMKRKAIESARKFTWEKAGRETLKAYMQILSREES